MALMKYLLDEKGKYLLMTPQTLDRFRTRGADGRLQSIQEAVTSVITTHGYAELWIGSPAGEQVIQKPTSIRLNISRLHDHTFAALLALLKTDKGLKQPVVMFWIDDDFRTWTQNYFETGQQAIHWLQSKMGVLDDPRFVSAPCPDDRLETEAPAFIELEALWREQDGYFNNWVRHRLFQLNLTNLFNFQRADTRGILRFTATGDGYKAGSRHRGFDTAIGRSLIEHPDGDYGRFCNADYEDALLHNRPIASIVDVYIQDPTPQFLRLSEYIRLILPWRDEYGSRFVMGTSILVPGKGLRASHSRWHLIARQMANPAATVRVSA